MKSILSVILKHKKETVMWIETKDRKHKLLNVNKVSAYEHNRAIMKLVFDDTISVRELTKKSTLIISKVKTRKMIDSILNIPNNEVDSHPLMGMVNRVLFSAFKN